MVVADGFVGFGSVGLEMKARARSTGGDSRYDSIWPPLSSILVVFLGCGFDWDLFVFAEGSR
jgi:hypothetical protein